MQFQNAFKALKKGDRDSVLEEIKFLPKSDEVLWLKANATEDEDERLRLLSQLAKSSNLILAEQSERIVARESKFRKIILSEPGWKFWKQGDWPQKRKRYLKQLFSVLFIALILFATIYLSQYFKAGKMSPEEQILQLTNTAIANFSFISTDVVTPTVTAIPAEERPSVSYPSGRLTIVRIEDPTYRDINFGDLNDSIVAAPAKGSYFLAIQLEFLCKQAICNDPPEAEIGLKLIDQNVVFYDSYSKPTFAETPDMERTAQGQTTVGWYVFEVPNSNQPISLIVNWDQEGVALELNLPN